MVSRGRLILRGSTGGLPKNQSVACEARHAPTGPRAGRAPLRTHGPPLRRLLCVLRVLCDSQNTLAVLRALARRPSLCLSVFSVVSVFFVIGGSHTGSPSVLRSPGRVSAPYGLIAAKGGGPGFNLCGSSKPPNLQTSKLPLQRKTRPDNVRGGVGLCVCVGECQNSTYYTTSASQNASTFFNFLSRPRKRPRANRLGASVWRDRRNEDEQLTLMLTSIE